MSPSRPRVGTPQPPPPSGGPGVSAGSLDPTQPCLADGCCAGVVTSHYIPGMVRGERQRVITYDCPDCGGTGLYRPDPES